MTNTTMINEMRAAGKAIASTKLENALEISERYKKHSHIVKIDNGYFLVVVPGVVAKLEAAGFEVVGLRGHRVVKVAELGQPIN